MSRATTLVSILIALSCFGCRDDRIQIGTHAELLPTEMTSTELSPSWPGLLGPHRNGVSTERNLDTRWPDAGPNLLWSIEVGSGYSSPVIVKESVVLLHRMSDEERIECFDANTGQSRWSYGYETTYRDDLDRYSDGPYSTPLIHDDHVYAVGAQGQMHCLLLTNGSVVWKRMLREEYEVPQSNYPVAASPWIDGNNLIFNLGAAEQNAGVIALHKETGETVWTATDESAGCATPCSATIHGKRHVIVFTKQSVVSLVPDTGEVRWIVPHECKAPDSENATSPIVEDDLLLAVTGPGPGSLCLRILPDGGYEEVWRNRRVLDSQFNSLICLNGFVYGFSAIGQGGASLRCVELATGKLRWRFNSDLDRGQGLSADGKLILLGEFGHLAALEADPVKPIQLSMTSEPVLEGPCYSSPALCRGKLYLRNEQRMLCLDVSGMPTEVASADEEMRD